MLIHIGNNDFIDLSECVAIVNLATIDEETRKLIAKSAGRKLGGHFHAAILTTHGKWIVSTLSPEALSHRSINEKFSAAFYESPLKSSDDNAFLEFDVDSETGDNENV